MKHYSCEPSEMVCCSLIDFDIDDEDRIHNLKFKGGCSGNLKAISRVVENMTANDAINYFSGIQCGYKPTSCTDQFARILKTVKSETQKDL